MKSTIILVAIVFLLIIVAMSVNFKPIPQTQNSYTSTAFSNEKYENPLNPELYYDSYSFQVNEYNIAEVVRKARENNYDIGYSISCVGPTHKECLQKGYIKDWSWENGNTNINKKLGISNVFVIPNESTEYNLTSISLNVIYDDFEFRAFPLNPIKDIYEWWIKIIPHSNNITITEAKEIIVHELKELGIIDDESYYNTFIQFHSYSPPVIIGFNYE